MIALASLETGLPPSVFIDDEWGHIMLDLVMERWKQREKDELMARVMNR